MISRKSLVITLTAIFVSLLLISYSSAQDTLLISYQGRLTDDGGDPITGTPAMTFAIYDAGGVSKWSELHPDVSVTNGLFSVVLGSQTALPDSVFNGDVRHLGISIEGDSEIEPRTQLTSSPGAAVSRRVVGDIRTAPGILEIHPPDPCVPSDQCEPALEMAAEPDKTIIRLHPPEPCVPPEPCNPAIEIASTTEHHSIIISKPPPDDFRPAIKLIANNENKIDLYYPEAESEQGIVQIGANEAEGGFIELHAADSLTLTRVMMGGSTTDTGFVRLYGGGSEAEYKLLELSSHTNLGGNIKFFDPENIGGRELLRIGGSPEAAAGAYRDFVASENKLAEGIGIYGFNPQPEPPGHIAFELTSEASEGGRLAVYDTEDANLVLTGGLMQLGHQDMPDHPTGTFSVTSSTSQLTLTGVASAADPPTITMVAGVDGVRVGIGAEAPSDELYVVGDITATGAITELSSAKYKTNINQLDNALAMVQNLRGVNYNWRTKEYPEMKFSEKQQVGLIAEEVEKVMPQLVHSDNDGEKSIDYSKLTTVLIEAVKEQQKLIEELSNRLEELEGTNISER